MASDRAIFFDLYDTLVHVTERTHQYTRLLEKILNYADGFSPEERKDIRAAFRYHFICSSTTTNIVDGLLNDINYFKDRPFLESILENIDETERNEMKMGVEREVASVVAYDNVHNVLERLSKRFKLVLVSNLASPFKKPFYDLGLDQYFEATVFSCDVERRKPEIGIFNYALEKCSIKDRSKIVVIGDKDHTDGRGAELAGLHYFRSTARPSFLNELEQFLK